MVGNKLKYFVVKKAFGTQESYKNITDIMVCNGGQFKLLFYYFLVIYLK